MKDYWENSREKDNKLIYNCTQGEWIYIKAKLLGLRVCSYLFLKFNSNLLWTCDNCCPNSLRPSFPTHSLKIYCLRLIGPLYYTFGPQIETLQVLYSNFFLLSFMWSYLKSWNGNIRCSICSVENVNFFRFKYSRLEILSNGKFNDIFLLLSSSFFIYFLT